jgi:hypothetical protein
MSENVDFKRISRFIAATDEEALIIDFLRDVWNARGAADFAAIEFSLSSQMGTSASLPYVNQIEHALRRLDR